MYYAELDARNLDISGRFFLNLEATWRYLSIDKKKNLQIKASLLISRSDELCYKYKGFYLCKKLLELEPNSVELLAYKANFFLILSYHRKALSVCDHITTLPEFNESEDTLKNMVLEIKNRCQLRLLDPDDPACLATEINFISSIERLRANTALNHNEDYLLTCKILVGIFDDNYDEGLRLFSMLFEQIRSFSSARGKFEFEVSSFTDTLAIVLDITETDENCQNTARLKLKELGFENKRVQLLEDLRRAPSTSNTAPNVTPQNTTRGVAIPSRSQESVSRRVESPMIHDQSTLANLHRRNETIASRGSLGNISSSQTPTVRRQATARLGLLPSSMTTRKLLDLSGVSNPERLRRIQTAQSRSDFRTVVNETNLHPMGFCTFWQGNYRPIDWAIYYSDCASINALIRGGADINIVNDHHRYTPLQTAIYQHGTCGLSTIGVVRTLLTLGANPNLKDTQHGWTALHYAIYYLAERDDIRKTIVEMLLNNNANPNIKTGLDNTGESALEMARRYNFPSDVIALLRSASLRENASSGNNATSNLNRTSPATRQAAPDNRTSPTRSVSQNSGSREVTSPSTRNAPSPENTRSRNNPTSNSNRTPLVVRQAAPVNTAATAALFRPSDRILIGSEAAQSSHANSCIHDRHALSDESRVTNSSNSSPSVPSSTTSSNLDRNSFAVQSKCLTM
jgi:hypothetical protein